MRSRLAKSAGKRARSAPNPPNAWRNTGPWGWALPPPPPLVGLRALSMLRLEDRHYFVISIQPETFGHIVPVVIPIHSVFCVRQPTIIPTDMIIESTEGWGWLYGGGRLVFSSSGSRALRGFPIPLNDDIRGTVTIGANIRGDFYISLRPSVFQRSLNLLEGQRAKDVFCNTSEAQLG